MSYGGILSINGKHVSSWHVLDLYVEQRERRQNIKIMSCRVHYSLYLHINKKHKWPRVTSHVFPFLILHFPFMAAKLSLRPHFSPPLKELKYWKSWKRTKKRKAKVKFYLCYLEDREFCLVGVMIFWRGRITLRKLSFGSLKVKVSNFQKVVRAPSCLSTLLK